MGEIRYTLKDNMRTIVIDEKNQIRVSKNDKKEIVIHFSKETTSITLNVIQAGILAGCIVSMANELDRE